jgi:glycosyltransferase involved in cell wall biosynthesis
MTDISVIITGHREGVLAGATARSALEAIAHAEQVCGVRCEVIVVLDRASDETRAVLQTGFAGRDPDSVRILETDEGDPGQARNHGIAAARGTCATFLDADDLWSYNWLSSSWEFCRKRPDAVAQSACNVVFGDLQALWWHIDSEGPLFDPHYLAWANYWDAMSFARTEIYRSHPFRRNDLVLGFGHEDWHWSAWTIAQGIPHKPVPETVHFKRRRAGSQMSLVDRAGALVWPLNVR